MNVRGINDKEKRNKLFYWLRRQKVDIVFLQETHCGNRASEYKWSKEWEAESYWSVDKSNSKGVAILFNKSKICSINGVNIVNSRLMYIDIQTDDEQMRLVNIYAPNNGRERKSFFNKDVKKIFHDDKEHIVGGDLNCALENIDRKNQTYSNEGRNELIYLMRKFKLEDILRRRKPTQIIYTYNKPNGENISRIDMWLISTSLDGQTTDVGTKVCPIVPDHKAIQLTLDLNITERGQGRWKMNDSVIKTEQFKQVFTSFWNEWTNKKREYRNKREWWEESKRKIKEITIAVSKTIKKKEEVEVQRLEKRIDDIKDGKNSEEIIDIKRKLQTYYSKKTEGARIRAKVKWKTEGEMSSKYFHGLEKTRGKQKLWTKIKDEKGNSVTGIENILKRQVAFYENLYTSQGIDRTEASKLLQNVTKSLSKEQASECEKDLSVEESIQCIKTLKVDSSPGMDGITNVFYRTFWSIIGKDLIEVMNESLKEGECCPSQYVGIIILHYKEGNREELTNWRPITLLNGDYKIMEKILAKRVKQVLPWLINEDQKGYVEGRNIGDAVRLNEDILEHCKKESKSGAVLYIDQSKAFDRVEWEWLILVMRKNGFGERFIGWIKTLYVKAQSLIFTNGYMSRKFKITRSVRQGAPLSAYLYILQAEPLAEAVRKSKDIKGVQIKTDETRSEEVKIAAYADDTQAYVTDRKSIENYFKWLSIYSRASGAKINNNKTTAIKIGNWEKKGEDEDINWSMNPVKALGVTQSEGTVDELYWEGKLEKMKKKVMKWENRNLTFRGKVHIVKSEILSTILYAIRLKTIPVKCKKKVDKIIWNFLWSGSVERVSRETCKRGLQQGGLGMPDIDKMVQVCRIKMLDRILSGEKQKWKELPRKYVKTLDNEYGIPMFALNVTDTSDVKKIKEIPIFYQEMITAWQQFKGLEEVECEKSVKEQYLWCNKSIQINNKALQDLGWAKLRS